ncbi:MAG: hypothetical protein AAGA18_02870 [Verrucomicrobiota bacterium]
MAKLLTIYIPIALLPALSLAESELAPLPPEPRPLKVPAIENNKLVEPVQDTGRVQPSQSLIEKQRDPYYLLSPKLRSDQNQGFYVGVLGGFNFYQDVSEPYNSGEAADQNTGLPAGTFIEAELENQEIGDALAGLKIGYSWRFTSTGIEILDRNNWRAGMALEFEFLYSDQTLDGRNIANTNEDTTIVLENFHFMTNALFLLQNNSWRPYVGVGVGAVYVNGTDYQYVSGFGAETAPNDSIVTISGQAIAGLEYFVSNDWSVFSEYKLLTMFDLNIFESELTSFGFEADMLIDSFMNHYLTLGIKRHF